MVDLLNRDVRFLLLEMSPDGILITLSNESSLINYRYGYFEEPEMKRIQGLLNTELISTYDNRKDLDKFNLLMNLGGPLPKLKSLIFSFYIDVNDIITISKFIQLYHFIENLSIGEVKGGDEGLKAIALALPKTMIKSLRYSYAQAGDEGYRYLSEAIPKSSLVRLEMWTNMNTIKGLEYLANSLMDPNTKIQEIDIFSPGLNLSNKEIRKIFSEIPSNIIARISSED